MKKIYSLFVALVAMCCSAVAQETASLTVNVDDASRVKIVIDYVEQTIVTGDNVFEYDPYAYAYMEIGGASGDYGITNVHAVYSDGSEENVSMWGGKAGISLSAYGNGAVYTVTSFSYAELRTATCTVNVDDASKVSFQRGNSTVDLVNGDNIIAFIPDGSNAETFSIRSTGGSLYQVLHNGEVASTDWSGSYSVSPANGDRIEIKANFPDVNVPVTFEAVNEGTEGFVTDVKVDGVAVDHLVENFSVKLGSTLEWTPNETDYKLNSILLNGAESSLYECRSITVLTEEPIIIKYDATKYATFNITVNIDHADRITLYKVVNYSQYEIPLVDGENTVEISQACSGLSFKAAGGCSVLSFTDAEGTEYKDYPKNYQDIPVAEGKAFTVTTSRVERNSSFIFYIDNPSRSDYGGCITLARETYDRSVMTDTLLFMDSYGNLTLEGGYYTINFDPIIDNPIYFYFYGSSTGTLNPILYQNDTVATYSTSKQYLTVADGEVIKAYLDGTPSFHNVTFDASSVTGYAFEEVVRDIIVPVADVTAPLSVLTGTQISFNVVGAPSVATPGAEVFVNDVVVTPGDNGYVITVTEDTKIEIKANTGTSVEYVEAAVNNNVYTLQGVLLITNATEAQIKALPAGLYIVNGKTTYLLQR